MDGSRVCRVGETGGDVEYLCRTTRSRSGLKDGRPSITVSEIGAVPEEPLESNGESCGNAAGLRGTLLVGESARSDGFGLSTGRMRADEGKSGPGELVAPVEVVLLALALAPAWIPFKTSSAVGRRSGSTASSISKNV
jgi:hypothetical protein